MELWIFFNAVSILSLFVVMTVQRADRKVVRMRVNDMQEWVWILLIPRPEQQAVLYLAEHPSV